MRTVHFLLTLFSLLTWSAAAAADLEHGHQLYTDPTLGGGSTGKTCQTCHESGRDLQPNLVHRRHFDVMGLTMTSAAEVVNFCIEVTLRGEGIDPQSKKMIDLLAYLEYLAAKDPGAIDPEPLPR